MAKLSSNLIFLIACAWMAVISEKTFGFAKDTKLLIAESSFFLSSVVEVELMLFMAVLTLSEALEAIELFITVFSVKTHKTPSAAAEKSTSDPSFIVARISNFDDATFSFSAGVIWQFFPEFPDLQLHVATLFTTEQTPFFVQKSGVQVSDDML